MAKSCRILLFNADPDEARELRTLVQRVPGGRLISEVSDTAKLPSAIKESPVDALVVNLDPDPEPVIAAATGLLSERADAVAIVAIGSSEDADLIRELMHAGIREYLPKPVDGGELTKALGRVLHDVKTDVPEGKVISVLGVAGGVGVTTVASNLAVELAQLCGQNVALFDLNFVFGQVGIFLNLLPTYTVSDVLVDPANIEMELLQKVVSKTDYKVDVLARPHHFEQAEVLHPGQALGVVARMQELYPYVVLDGPHGFGAPARQLIQVADRVIMLMQLTVPAVRNVTRTFQEFDRHGLRVDTVDLVVNRMGIYKDLDVAQAEKALNARIKATIPDEWATVRDAINIGEPLIKAAPKSKVRQAIESLARWIHTGQTVQIETAARKEGLLGLFRRG